MFTKEKELKIYGYLMFCFGILDVVHLSMDILEANSLLQNYSKAVAIGTYVFFGVCALITLAKFWMGRQALCYAKGTGKGTSHIRLAKIALVFTVLVLALDVFAWVSGTSTSSEVISTSATVIVIYSYYRAAKACL